MPRVGRVLLLAAIALCATAVASLVAGAASTSAGPACPVLYSGSRHTCYVYPNAGTVKRAERQMPVRVVDPVAMVRRVYEVTWNDGDLLRSILIRCHLTGLWRHLPRLTHVLAHA